MRLSGQGERQYIVYPVGQASRLSGRARRLSHPRRQTAVSTPVDNFRNFSASEIVPQVQGIVNSDDHRLIRECLKGKTEAFGELVRCYQDRLYRCLYRMFGNAEDTLDTVQEAFLNAFQNLDSFKGDSLFFTWLYRIAVNTAISSKRKQRMVLSIDASSDSEAAIEPLDPSEYNRPSQALEQAEQEKRIQQALARLSAEHRAVLVMKDMQGEKYETMAEVLGVPIGTVRSRLHRARLELREILEEDES
jgi:RNA polymerase sigma-70 factor, ECF subfamily